MAERLDSTCRASLDLRSLSRRMTAESGKASAEKYSRRCSTLSSRMRNSVRVRSGTRRPAPSFTVTGRITKFTLTRSVPWLSDGAVVRGGVLSGACAAGACGAGGGFTFGTGAGGGSCASKPATPKARSAKTARLTPDPENCVFRGLFIFSQPNSYSFYLSGTRFRRHAGANASLPMFRRILCSQGLGAAALLRVCKTALNPDTVWMQKRPSPVVSHFGDSPTASGRLAAITRKSIHAFSEEFVEAGGGGCARRDSGVPGGSAGGRAAPGAGTGLETHGKPGQFVCHGAR